MHCTSLLTGNNIYGDEICSVLESLNSTERTAYILMDKIQSRPTYNYLCRAGEPLKLKMCLSELGVFGAYIRYTADFTVNSQTIFWETDALLVNLTCFGRRQKSNWPFIIQTGNPTNLFYCPSGEEHRFWWMSVWATCSGQRVQNTQTEVLLQELQCLTIHYWFNLNISSRTVCWWTYPGFISE